MRFSIIAAAAPLLALTEAVWPQPQSITTGNSTVWIRPDVEFTYTPLSGGGYYGNGYPSGHRRLRNRNANSSDSELVNKAFDRFRGTLQRGAYDPWRFFPKGTQYEPTETYNAPTIERVEVIQVPANSSSGGGNSSSLYPDESYTLELGEDGATTIRAASAIGAMHALNTLAQLFYLTGDGERYYSTEAPVSISDYPTFPWRGFNVDLSRNYRSPDEVKRLIDGLAFNKFSRLHVHATDSQSWPIEIPALPDLARNGAYTPDRVWSVEDLRSVQQYAQERGIEAYIEIDSPGHTASLHDTYPELITGYNQQPWAGSASTPPYCNEPPCGQVRLNDPAVDQFFETLYSDLLPRAAPFSGWFHSGGDEVNLNVYNFDDSVGNTNDSQVLQPYLDRFMNRLNEQVAAQGMRQLVWEEMILVWNLSLPTSNTLVQAWQPGSLPEVVSRGYDAIFGDYTYWYLDCGYGQWIDPNVTNANTPIVPPYTDYCDPQKNWRHIYAYDPRENVTEADYSRIQGGECHLWAELTDETNFDAKAWPRASAAGEVLWTGPQGTEGVNESVTRRLSDMRERLVGLGFEPQLIQMTFCLQNPGSCSA